MTPKHYYAPSEIYTLGERVKLLFVYGGGVTGTVGYFVFGAVFGTSFSFADFFSSFFLLTTCGVGVDGISSRLFSKGYKMFPATLLPAAVAEQSPASVSVSVFDTVVKHAATAHVKTNITALEYKLYLLLYKKVRDCGLENKKYAIERAEIANFLGGKVAHDRERLTGYFKNLQETTVTWNILGADRKNAKKWKRIESGGAGFISSYKVHEKEVIFEMSEAMKELICDPSIFFSINLQIFKMLEGKFSLRWYEILNVELALAGSNSNTVTTQTYLNNDIRELMGLESNNYSDTKKLMQVCVRNPIKDMLAVVNRYEKMTVEPKYVKQGRKIEGVKFDVTRELLDEARQLSLFEAEAEIQIEAETVAVTDIVETEAVAAGDTEAVEIGDVATGDVVAVEAEAVAAGDTGDESVVKLLKTIFTERVAERRYATIKKDYPEIKDYYSFVKSNIDYCEENNKRHPSNVKNLKGYITDSFKENYANYDEVKYIEEQKKKQEQAERIKNQTEADRLRCEEETKAFEQKHKDEAEILSKELPKYGLDEETDLWQECLKTIEGEVNESTYEMWFHSCGQMFMNKENDAYIIANNQFACDMLDRDFKDIIKKSFEATGADIEYIHIVTFDEMSATFLSKN
jgi:hypothetical protein